MPRRCVGAHHLSRKLKALGYDARLMPAKYVRPYSKGQKFSAQEPQALPNDHAPLQQKGANLIDDAGAPPPSLSSADR
jgi:transposase